MSDATSFEEWQAAMALQYIASFNFVYANEDGVIHFVHNAMMPDRAEGWQWDQYLPGDRSDSDLAILFAPGGLAECDEPLVRLCPQCQSIPFSHQLRGQQPDPRRLSQGERLAHTDDQSRGARVRAARRQHGDHV